MERQREASGTLGSRPINASVSDKRKGEVALPLPRYVGALARPFNHTGGCMSYRGKAFVLVLTLGILFWVGVFYLVSLI